MNESRIDKIVDFEKYCKTCKFANIVVGECGDMAEPCNECLGEPVNENSQRPVKYQADEKLIKKQEEYDKKIETSNEETV